jgi:hypothetical protein
VVAACIAAVALVVLPRVPGPVGVRATPVAVAFVALVAEALPFLLLGAAIAALLEGRPGAAMARAAIRHPRLAVVVNGFAAGARLTNPVLILSTIRSGRMLGEDDWSR